MAPWAGLQDKMAAGSLSAASRAVTPGHVAFLQAFGPYGFVRFLFKQKCRLADGYIGSPAEF